MNEETLNISIRQFLKTVGVKSQREIEHAVATALAEQSIAGKETLPATMRLQVAGINVDVLFEGDIKLE